MNILTITDTDRHCFEWQTQQEKKQKKLPSHEKILMPTHIAHICICLPHTRQPKGKGKRVQSPTLFREKTPILQFQIFKQIKKTE
ncbi:hypothetical protein [Flavobacterium filum]|uniref:hypothetical protein n=1 Tax=Flavobacterium filum TaxID=370974 RepID=UPI0023F10740|nr:hypothetical protein [Flavobacterium filum]